MKSRLLTFRFLALALAPAIVGAQAAPAAAGRETNGDVIEEIWERQ